MLYFFGSGTLFGCVVTPSLSASAFTTPLFVGLDFIVLILGKCVNPRMNIPLLVFHLFAKN